MLYEVITIRSDCQKENIRASAEARIVRVITSYSIHYTKLYDDDKKAGKETLGPRPAWQARSAGIAITVAAGYWRLIPCHHFLRAYPSARKAAILCHNGENAVRLGQKLWSLPISTSKWCIKPKCSSSSIEYCAVFVVIV